jgi:DNA-binding LacI/PurR family transcriptional regulator
MSTLGHRPSLVLARLRQGLDDGTWPPGSLLPREVDLCERFAVSRRTVRAALAVLAQEGLVEPRKRLGTMVLERQRRGLVGVQWSTERGLIARAESRLFAAGCLPVSYSAGPDSWSRDAEAGFLARLLDERARGLLAIATPLDGGNPALFRRLARAGCRVVHLEPHGNEDPAEEFCMPDYVAFGAAACQRLRQAGARTVRFATTEPQAPYGRRLLRGLAAAGGAVEPLVLAPRQPESLTAQAHALPPATGLLFVGGQLAASTLPALRAAGHRGPVLACAMDSGDVVSACPVLSIPRLACADAALDRILAPTAPRLRRLVGPPP